MAVSLETIVVDVTVVVVNRRTPMRLCDMGRKFHVLKYLLSIRDISSLNSGSESGYLTQSFCGFPQCLSTNAEVTAVNDLDIFKTEA